MKGVHVALSYRSWCTLKHRWFSTLLFIAAPIFLSSLLFFYKNHLNSSLSNGGNEPSVVPPPFDKQRILTSFTNNIDLVAAYPDNPDVRKLMTQVGVVFGDTFRFGPVQYTNSLEEMEEYMYNQTDRKAFGSDGFGIIFQELSSAGLSYTLRSTSPQGWYTSQGFPSEMVPGPMEAGLFYFFRGFVPLQVAINEAYSQVFHNYTLPEWELQEFPYPSYKRVEEYQLQFQLQQVLCSFSICFLLVRFAVMLVEEKASGMKELLKINGVSNLMNYVSWLTFFGAISFFIVLTITIMWKLPLEHGAILPNTNAIVFFIMLYIFFIASICSVTFISSLIHQPKYTLLLITAYWIATTVVISLVLNYFRSTPLLIIIALIPFGGNIGIFEALAEFEAAGPGATFSNLFTSPPVPTNILPIGVNLIIMACSIVMYMLLALYIDAVRPGPFGRARRWNFFISRGWTRVNAERDALLHEEKHLPINSKIEEVKNGAPVGLKLEKLVKVFGELKAVDNLNINIYKNQITALLGHNGAGKSTLFSMISGMCSPTSGTIYSEDYDIFEGDNLEKFRQSLGFCPQHDLLMSTLTTQQHLIMFGMLKGMNFSEAKAEGAHWMNQFKVYDSRHKLVSELSGGMKRKLCLSLSLVGRPALLLLDEPTSGLDPQSRRDIWDVLLSIRGNRTIVISTHFMEEADILGDKIAVVAHGRLRCYGSRLFLKNLYGSGYQMNYSFDGPKIEVERLIQKIVPNAVINKKTDKIMCAQLPSSAVEHFPKLFRAIDKEFGSNIEYTLSCPTMDDVFLRIQEEEGVQMSVDEVDMPTMIEEIDKHRDKLSCVRKTWDHIKALFYKRYMWSISKWLSLFIYMILVPLLAVLLTVNGSTKALSEAKIDNVSLLLDMYPESLALIGKKDINGSAATFFEKAISSNGGSFVEIPSTENMTLALLQRATEDLLAYRTHMIVSFDDRATPNVLFSTLAYHSAPIAINMLTNALLKQANFSAQIVTDNFPYQFKQEACVNIGLSMILSLVLWISVYGFGTLMVGSYSILVPHTERISGVKHLQYMCGLQPITYWICNLIVDSMLCLLPILITLSVVFILDNQFFTTCLVLCSFGLVIILSAISNICFAYLCSFSFNSHTSAVQLYIFFMAITALCSSIAEQFAVTSWLPYVLFLVPWVPFTYALAKIIQYASQISMCSTCKIGPIHDACMAQEASASFSSLNINKEIIYIVADSIMLLVIVCAIDYGLFRTLSYYMKRIVHGNILTDTSTNNLSDLDVVGEKNVVDASKNKPTIRSDADPGPIFVCDNLAKKYSRTFTAVYDVTFAIRKGECFGLLGVNGAGKSTTFGMLTGTLVPSRGDARIMNFTLSSNRNAYLKRLGYCPQIDGLLLDLSARTLLLTFGRLRHIPPDALQTVTKKWIDALDMTDICDRPCQHYSGGNKRKLSTAIALIGNPPVVLLDEPTTGVDPVLRRKIWSILKYSREVNHQTVIVTSHSMDECEALCDRLTIMVKGSMKCIGTIPHLKNRYGHGYILLVKLKGTITDAEMNKMQQLLIGKFKNHITLQETQHGLLTFKIDSREVELYRIFETMNHIKSEIAYLEEFYITAASLEHVFLSLAKNG